MFGLLYQGKKWSKEELCDLQAQDDYILDFCRMWFNGEKQFLFHTSGSTGKPKKIQLKREVLEKSASKSIEALGLTSINSALLCMNPLFVGGTQMIVRAILANYSLYVLPPSNNPINKDTPPVDFISLVPMQLQSIMGSETGRQFLKNCKVILLGGAPINPQLEKLVENLDTRVCHSYGMTETASHIALRNINGHNRSDYFSLLPGMEISTAENGCLRIKGDLTDNNWLETNDLVEITGNSNFRILGRADNVINSGGIKISPEEIENQILTYIHSEAGIPRFIISSQPDDTLGEKMVLVTDDKSEKWLELLEKIEWKQYKKPREIVIIDAIPLTYSQKVDRIKVREMIN